MHYDTNDKEHKDFSNDIEFDLSYVNPNIHIKMVYNVFILEIEILYGSFEITKRVHWRRR